MAEEHEDQAPAASGGGGGSFFTRRLAGIPVWVLMAAGLGIALALSSIQRNRQSAGATGSTSSNTAATSLSAQTPPFIIQNYPNSPNVPAAAPSTTTQPPGSSQPQVVSVGHNQPVQEVINWAQKNGFPNYSWSDFWALNPTLTGLKQDQKGTWILTGWGSPVTLAKPGFISTGGASGAISNDYSKPIVF
jgi:hypothetical protein